MREMIYDFTTHSLYYENQGVEIPNFSLTIDTLEMVFELQTGKLLCIQGFFPLIKAVKSNVHLPVCDKADYLLRNFDLSTCNQNEVYDLTKKMPQTQKYFEKISIKNSQIALAVSIDRRCLTSASDGMLTEVSTVNTLSIAKA